YDWIQRHFEEYFKVRVPTKEILDVFQPGEAPKLMKARRVLQILIDAEKTLIFSPMVVGKYDLGDLERVKPVADKRIPLDSPPELFWEMFDQVLSIAPESK